MCYWHPTPPITLLPFSKVHVLGALPLRNLSRLWGYLNSFQLPVWFRPTGIRVYSAIFGCDLSEVEHSDLTKYKSLGDFFYRRLKDGARPIDSAVLVRIERYATHCHVLTYSPFRSRLLTVEYCISAQLKVFASNRSKDSRTP